LGVVKHHAALAEDIQRSKEKKEKKGIKYKKGNKKEKNRK
jgi:hypothetical protein